jgi:hypothetical protein
MYVIRRYKFYFQNGQYLQTEVTSISCDYQFIMDVE